MRTALRLEGGAPEPPQDRGRLMDAKAVSEVIFAGMVSEAWVRRNVPGKLSPSHSKVFWWEYEVAAWFETTRGDVA